MKSILGISLIELMVAIAVIGIAAAVAIPSYRVYVASSESNACLRLITPSRLVADSIILENGGDASSIGVDVTVVGLTANPEQCEGGVAVNGTEEGAVTLSGTVNTSLGNNTMTWTRTAADGIWQCSSSAVASAAGFAPETCP